MFRSSAWPFFVAPSFAALCYPFLLRAFHLSVGQPGLSWATLSALLLALAIAAPLIGIYVVCKLGAVEDPPPPVLKAKILALLSVGAPPMYTALGVLLGIWHIATSDLIFWVALWVVLIVLVAFTVEPRPAQPRLFSRLRYAHGVSAATLVLIFLFMHLTNHLAGLWSEAAHRMVMDAFRHVYRAGFVEPILVCLFLFQVVSGPFLVWQYARRAVDGYRSLQIASGAYLLFYVPAHMNSVFIYARTVAKIPTDWNFAVGAPTGLLHDAWNIRLLPHYLLGVFLVVTHLLLGARVIALAHGVREATANRLTIAGIVAAGALATAIMVGMVGIHIQ